MLLGTARGEIQLPAALPGYALGAISGQKHAPEPPLYDEFEGIAVAPEVAGVEMPADHQRRRIGETGE